VKPRREKRTISSQIDEGLLIRSIQARDGKGLRSSRLSSLGKRDLPKKEDGERW